MNQASKRFWRLFKIIIYHLRNEYDFPQASAANEVSASERRSDRQGADQTNPSTWNLEPIPAVRFPSLESGKSVHQTAWGALRRSEPDGMNMISESKNLQAMDDGS